MRPYRFASNPHERAAAEHWNKINSGGTHLSFLFGQNNDRGHLSERDEFVAATLMQWLGSPVGQCYMRDLAETFAKIDKELKEQK